MHCIVFSKLVIYKKYILYNGHDDGRNMTFDDGKKIRSRIDHARKVSRRLQVLKSWDQKVQIEKVAVEAIIVREVLHWFCSEVGSYYT